MKMNFDFNTDTITELLGAIIAAIGIVVVAGIFSFTIFSGILWVLIACINALNLGLALTFTWKISFLLWIIYCLIKQLF